MLTGQEHSLRKNVSKGAGPLRRRHCFVAHFHQLSARILIRQEGPVATAVVLPPCQVFWADASAGRPSIVVQQVGDQSHSPFRHACVPRHTKAAPELCFCLAKEQSQS